MFEVGDRGVLQVYTPLPYPMVETWPASIIKVTDSSIVVQYWDEYVDDYGDEHEVLRTTEITENNPNVKFL